MDATVSTVKGRNATVASAHRTLGAAGRNRGARHALRKKVQVATKCAPATVLMLARHKSSAQILSQVPML